MDNWLKSSDLIKQGRDSLAATAGGTGLKDEIAGLSESHDRLFGSGKLPVKEEKLPRKIWGTNLLLNGGNRASTVFPTRAHTGPINEKLN